MPKTIRNGAYVINLDEYAYVGTRWIDLYVKNNELIYFDSFGAEYVPKEIKRFIVIQADSSIMYGCLYWIH